MMESGWRPCAVTLAQSIQEVQHDFICVIDNQVPSEIAQTLKDCSECDKAFNSEITCFKSPNFKVPVVYSPLGNLSDYHDVRAYQEAAAKAVNRAVKAGAKQPLLMIPRNSNFKNAAICTILGALQELYVPIQLREDVPEKKQRISTLTVHMHGQDLGKVEGIYREALLLEAGRFIARDIGVGDPERMAPPNVERYVKAAFPNLKINVISDPAVLQKEYPLFQAVNRAACSVARHQGRIIFLEYVPPQPAKKTLCLVGKGVTYDTGGADIKAGGIMAGMSRDKCGAAAVAGFMKVVEQKKPSDVHVIAALCMVRNSVGEECYVSDEVITSRAGVRVRVGNTDAEGRMAMTDAVCKMKELAAGAPDPHIFTIATLTGHAFIAVGEGYSIVIDNSVARKCQHAEKLKKIGDEIGDPLEISTLRQDDFDFNNAQVIGEDVVQCNNSPSSKTPRGHQVPVSFMIVSSGLDKHGLTSAKPIKYSHLDIAGSAGEYPKMPTGSPIIALAKTHLDF